MVNEGRRLGRSHRQVYQGFEGPSSSRPHIHLLTKLLKNPSEDGTLSICYFDGERNCLLPLRVFKRNSTSTWTRSTEHDSVVRGCVNTDGSPLSKSCLSHFHPIMFLIEGEQTPFPVGIYHGHQKPGSANELLGMFVEEASR